MTRLWPLYSLSELDQLPQPKWLIDNHITDGLSVVYGPPGTGKAQPLDEAVLTPDGYRKMGDIQPGDMVIGSDGLPVAVLDVHPQGEVDEWRIGFSDGTSVRCSADHLWAARKGYEGRWSTVKTSELAYSGHHKETKWQVPLVGPVAFRDSGDPLPLDPYLLGALLGDGGITCFCGFSSADEPVLAEVRRRLPPGCELVQYQEGADYRIVSPRGQPNPVWTALRILGLAGHKSEHKWVPDEYLHAPPAERLALLQGLMDTDGWVGGKSDGGTVAEFSCASRQLTEAVQFLVRSLGGIARAVLVKRTAGLPAYRVSFRMGRGTNPFRLPRKAERVSDSRRRLHRRIDSVEPTGRHVSMQCIRVAAPDGLYVTKDFIVTHNTFLALSWALAIASGRYWFGQRVEPTPVIYVSGEGAGGLARRIVAWQSDVQTYNAQFYLIVGTVQLTTREHVMALREDVHSTGAKLVIVDTLARAMAGADENSSQDMGLVIQGLDWLRRETGCAAMIVHHSGVEKARPRGSTALFGAADTLVRVDGSDMELEVSCEKQKDAAPFGRWSLALKHVGESVVLTTSARRARGFVPGEAY